MNETFAPTRDAARARIGGALKGVSRVLTIAEPHLAPGLESWAVCKAAPTGLQTVEQRCDSFSRWRGCASRGLDSAADLLTVNEVLA